MKNITVDAAQASVEGARRRAWSRQTSLNAEFREWLRQYAGGEASRESWDADYQALMRRLRSYVRVGERRFTRDEMNERSVFS